jgi:hypothetical protein
MKMQKDDFEFFLELAFVAFLIVATSAVGYLLVVAFILLL